MTATSGEGSGPQLLCAWGLPATPRGAASRGRGAAWAPTPSPSEGRPKATGRGSLLVRGPAAGCWEQRSGSARVQARNWGWMAFGCLLLSGGLAASLVWQSTQGTITPWVVEVDRRGQAQAVAPASPFYQPTDPQIAFHLARFIEDVPGFPTHASVLRPGLPQR